MFIHVDKDGHYTIVERPYTWDANGRFVKIIPVPEKIGKEDLQTLLHYLGYKEI